MRVARVVERVGTSPRTVDELVEHDEVAGMDVGRQRTCGAGRDHLAHPEHAHRPEVGARGNACGHELVVASVAGDEGNAPSAHLGDRDRCARRAERCVENDLFDAGFVDLVAERIKARASEDADLHRGGRRHFSGYALLASELLEPEPDEPLSDDFDEDESEPEGEPDEPDEPEESEPELDDPESEDDEDDDSFERSLEAPFDEERLSVL
jgi:hypothetical protein